MADQSRIPRVLLILACITLVATSAMHFLGFAPVSKLLAGSNVPPEWAGGLRGLWADFSAHLLVLAALVGVTAARRSPSLRPVVLVCGLAQVVDGVILGVFVGLFVGTVALALSSVLTLAAWVKYPRA